VQKSNLHRQSAPTDMALLVKLRLKSRVFYRFHKVITRQLTTSMVAARLLSWSHSTHRGLSPQVERRLNHQTFNRNLQHFFNLTSTDISPQRRSRLSAKHLFGHPFFAS
jgi:hypothetical protein